MRVRKVDGRIRLGKGKRKYGRKFGKGRNIGEREKWMQESFW